MGLRTIEIDAASSTSAQQESAQLTRGTLTSVMAAKIVNAPAIPTFAYAILSLYRNNENLENRIAILTEGYILTRYGLHWDGTIPIDEDMLLVLTVLGYTGDRYRATATLIDPQVASSGVPRDP